METYKRNKHAGHNLHCTIITGWKFAGAYRKIAKKKKKANNQSARRHEAQEAVIVK